MKWSGESGHACEDQQHKHPYMIDGHLLKLNMRRPVYELHYNQTSGGTIFGVPSAGSAGTVFNLSASPSAQYTLNTYSVTGAELTGNAGTFVNSDVTAQASWTYHPAPYMKTNVGGSAFVYNHATDQTQYVYNTYASGSEFNCWDGYHGEHNGPDPSRAMLFRYIPSTGTSRKREVATKLFVNGDNVAEPTGHDLHFRFNFGNVSALANDELAYFKDTGWQQILKGYNKTLNPGSNSYTQFKCTNVLSAGINLGPSGAFSASNIVPLEIEYWTPTYLGVGSAYKTLSSLSAYGLDYANSKVKLTCGNRTETFRLNDPRFHTRSAYYHDPSTSYCDIISGTFKIDLMALGMNVFEGNSTLTAAFDLKRIDGQPWSSVYRMYGNDPQYNELLLPARVDTMKWTGAFWVLK